MMQGNSKQTDRQIEVIIPVYNCIQYLETAVYSVLRQSYKNIEIILVDDGSTDGSEALCDTLANLQEQVIVIHQENGGVSAARNTGIEYVLSKYEGQEDKLYIAFLDADDAWNDGFFTEEIEELLEKSYDLIGFQSCMCNERMTRRNKPLKLVPGQYRGGKSSIWIHGTQHFGAAFYKLTLLSKYNIRFHNLKYTEDKIFSMSCLYLAEMIKTENLFFYQYRQNENSVMHNRLFGISYFAPMIRAYFNWNMEMLQWKNEARGEQREGIILSKIYLEDMVKEHFQMGGSKKELIDFLEKDEICQKVLSIFDKRKEEFIPKSYYDIGKYRIKGILKQLYWKIKKINVVIFFMDLIKYPIKIEN